MKNHALIRNLLSYEPTIGIIVWKESRRGGVKAGDVAGCKAADGYRCVTVGRKHYYEHVLAWFLYHGYFPENDIDHINRIKTDNKISNLREVSRQCNIRNQPVQKNNKSGIAGVCFDSGRNRWKAQIKVDRKSKTLGFFKDFEEAVAHRYAAEQCLGWAGCDLSSSAYKYIKANIRTRV